MELLLDADGKVVVRNGKPVYKTKDGKEIEYDAVGVTATVARLQTELGESRTKVTELAAVADKFKDLDPVAAKKALDTVKNLDDKKLVDAGEVEKVKNETRTALENQYKPVSDENVRLKDELFNEKVGGAFARSKFIAEKVAIPADMLQARFGRQVKLEDGKIVAYHANGNKVYSQSNPGELASFDEALEILVGEYPDKARILKGTGASGGGAPAGGGNNGGNGGKATITRSEFNKLNAAEQANRGKEAAQGKLAIVDG